jgi:hypothetical protein
MAKKAFFYENRKSQIKQKERADIDGFIQEEGIRVIADLQPGEYAVIPEIVPRGYSSARQFMKHGPEVKPKRMTSIREAISMAKTPVQLREEAFNSLNSQDYCGYTFMPLGRDERKRKVSLIECLEGARIFAYANQSGFPIKVKAYSDAKRVRKDGAEVIVDVPSRTKKQGRMQYKLNSVPMVDSPEKYAISLNIGSDHSCPSKRFNIRYKYSDDKESSGIVNLCAHEIAGYLELIQKTWEEDKNMVPLQMCQFAIPTQETVDYYLRLENNVLVEDPRLKSKDKLRKPNRAEKEIALWGLVQGLGHDRTFFSTKSRDGSVGDYNWDIPNDF